MTEMSYRLSYLENFHLSNFHYLASEAANKFEKLKVIHISKT